MYNLPESDFFKIFKFGKEHTFDLENKNKKWKYKHSRDPDFIFSDTESETNKSIHIQLLKEQRIRKSKTIRNEMESDVSGYNFKLEIYLH